MEKLQGWNMTLWTYWDTIQGSTTAVETKHGMWRRLEDYKNSMDKVGMMLTDHMRTQFVVVCIAEYLSIAESSRLLDELHNYKIRSGIVVCNQLLPLLSTSAADWAAKDDSESWKALRLVLSQNKIQVKYLWELKWIHHVKHVIEIQKQDREITGIEGLQHFASMLL